MVAGLLKERTAECDVIQRRLEDAENQLLKTDDLSASIQSYRQQVTELKTQLDKVSFVIWIFHYYYYYYIHLTAFFQDKPGKPAPEKQNHSGKTNLDLLEQETVSGSGISWAICKCAPRSRQITMPAPHHSVCYRPDALPAAQPTASKH